MCVGPKLYPELYAWKQTGSGSTGHQQTCWLMALVFFCHTKLCEHFNRNLPRASPLFLSVFRPRQMFITKIKPNHSLTLEKWDRSPIMDEETEAQRAGMQAQVPAEGDWNLGVSGLHAGSPHLARPFSASCCFALGWRLEHFLVPFLLLPSLSLSCPLGLGCGLATTKGPRTPSVKSVVSGTRWPAE